MKSFFSLAFASFIALTGAQVSYDPSNDTFVCAQPNGAYCAGDSLSTNIIIRCNGYIGSPANCDDNLSGQFPQGVNSAQCYEPSAESGLAACSKNCIIYGNNGMSTVPNCTPSPSTTLSGPSSSIPTNTKAHTHTKNTTKTGVVSRNATFTRSHGTRPATLIYLTTAPSSGPTGFASLNSTVTAINNNNGGNPSPTATPVGPTTAAAAFSSGSGATANTAITGLLVVSLCIGASFL